MASPAAVRRSASCRQSAVGRNPGRLDFPIRRNVRERGACIHMPFRFARIVQDMFAGREIALVILKDLDQGRS